MRDLLSGPNVRLTAIRDADLETIEGWFNDVRFLRFYDMIPALPKQQREVKKFLDSFLDNNEKYIFAVRCRESEAIIGIAGFYDIIWSNGVATLFIGIGEDRYKSRGWGKEALQLLLDFGFNELNFYRIQLYVISYNKVAVNLYESQGFIREGKHRNFVLRDGKRYDLYLYGLLKEEWQKQIGVLQENYPINPVLVSGGQGLTFSKK